MKAGWTEQEINQALTKIKPTVDRKQALDELQNYIVISLRKGKKEYDIKKTLEKAGWHTDDLDKALLKAKIFIAQETAESKEETRDKKDFEYADKKLDELLGKNKKK